MYLLSLPNKKMDLGDDSEFILQIENILCK